MFLSSRFALAVAAALVGLGCCSAAQNDAANAQEEPVLNWKREGGIAGFCDQLAIWNSGKVQATSCKPAGASRTGRLQKHHAAQLQQWIRSLRTTAIADNDAGVNDSLSVSLSLKGKGGNAPSAQEKQAMLDFASELFYSHNP
jgi:hypothetical protein